jgi:hypothetical protein
MMNKDLKWLDDDFQNYGVVNLESEESVQENKPLTDTKPIELEPMSLKLAFDIDTQEVVKRLKTVILTVNSDKVFENSHPDLYAPFWLVTTLILLISAAAHFQNKKITTLASLATLIYSLFLLVPGILYCLLSPSCPSLQYLRLLSLYGYSYCHFFLAAIVSFLPYLELGLLFWALSFCGSLFFLYKTLFPSLFGVSQGHKTLVFGVLASSHLLLLISTNLYFLAS